MRISGTNKSNSSEQLSFKQLNINFHKISKELLKKYQSDINSVQDQMIEELEAGLIPSLGIVYNNKDCTEIKKLADEIVRKFKKVVVLGVGGSSLGGKTLTAIKNNPRIEINFLESIDSQTVKNQIAKTDIKTTLFLVISKSGETIETICQTLIFINEFNKKKIKDLSGNFLFITQDHNNSIAKIAKKINAPIYDHPKDIGGRFSYLTIVGLLPAALAGLNLKVIRNGARKILDQFITRNKDNSVFKSCVRQLYLCNHGFSHNVVMPYIDSLKDFTDWYRQLWAESLGKKGFGSTPINSMGTIDQHSQLQLYLEGPKDKFFTFITRKNHGSNFIIKDLPGLKTRFGGHSLGKIVTVEQDTTIEALQLKKVPIRVFEVTNMDEETLSGIMMQMFIETIIIAKVKGINPFDQPAVEFRKELTKKYL